MNQQCLFLPASSLVHLWKCSSLERQCDLTNGQAAPFPRCEQNAPVNQQRREPLVLGLLWILCVCRTRPFGSPPPPLNCFEGPRRAPQSAETQLIAESVARQRAAWPGPTTTAGRGAGPRSAAASRRAPARTSSRRGCRIDHRARGRPSLRRACKADPRAEPLHDPHRRRPELLAPQLWTAS